MKGKYKEYKNIEIYNVGDKGKGVGKLPEGKVVFVDFVAPGDIVDIVVYKKKKDYCEANPVAFQQYSKDRTDPFCEHFSVCGGCKWQHVRYEAQLRYKQDIVENAIRRIGKVEVEEILPIVGAQRTRYYRNKLEFTFSNKRWLTSEEIESGISNQVDVLGFHRPGAFDKIVRIDQCYLQPDPSNEIRNTMKDIGIDQGLSFWDARQKSGFLRNVIIRVSSIGEIMLVVSFSGYDQKKIDKYLNTLCERFPQITSLYYCINNKVNDYILDLEMNLFHGNAQIVEELGHVKFMIGPKSFFQTNTYQALKLYDIVRDFAQLSGEENVYDLYSGLGSIAQYLAKDCKSITGIEEVEAAVEDALSNVRINRIDNCSFYSGDVKNILEKEFFTKHGKPDVVITDPPRAGMHEKVIDILKQLSPERIVYVSCNPATQARDLNLLHEFYRIKKIQPVDMFPFTHHIENVALLERRKL